MVALREVLGRELVVLLVLALAFALVVVLGLLFLAREDVPPRVVLRAGLGLVLLFLRVVVFLCAIAQMFTIIAHPSPDSHFK